MSSKRLTAVLIGLAVVAVGAVLFFSVGFLWIRETQSRIAHRSQHQHTYETVLRPMAEWVRTFRAHAGRLPTDAEVKSYAETHFPNLSVGVFPPRTGTSGRTGVDFQVYVNIDDWNLYYESLDGREWKAWTD